MKWSPDLRSRIIAAGTLGIMLAGLAARAELPLWMQTVVSGSAIEAALYRTMEIPGLRTLYPRPPAEARSQVDTLLHTSASAELYAMRAHLDEQALDFTAAEHDWTAYVAASASKATADFELAAYYQRRNEAAKQIAALEAAAAQPSIPSDQFLPADQQQAWKAFPNALQVAKDQALGDDATIAIHRAWISRYPAEPAPRANLISALLSMKRFDDAQHTIDEYKQAFPQDQLLPIKAEALLAFAQGNSAATARALDLFDKSYQPLWPADLTQTYLQLLEATHTQHAMLSINQALLLKNPDDLAAATKVFAYYQHQGHIEAAINAFTQYGASKQARHAAWTADELYTFATLLDRASQYEEAAHFYYALATASGKITAAQQSPEEAALCGVIHILLAAPDQALAIGAGNLSIYRDLASIDRGPGFLNGILSLWLNSQSTSSEFAQEEAKATPYFHRAKAAELLAVLDRRFPTSAQRASLHASLIQAYLVYGDDTAVKTAGQRFLADFTHADERLQVALAVADADARTKDTAAEFALYDSLLTELTADLHGMPLTAGSTPEPLASASTTPSDDAAAGDVSSEETPATPAKPTASELLGQALTVPANTPSTAAIAKSYREILDRYLGRLITTGQQAAALAVLRHELDRSPDDPLLYERLADFLQQNNLDAQQEEVYKQAISRFSSNDFYDKLARFYLRKRRQQDFAALTRTVADTFSGTQLESYFRNVDQTWPQEYLQLNLYAHKRFPHELVFTRNLLNAYQAKTTADAAAYDLLLHEHWHESPDLQAEFFDYLSRSHALDKELATLQALTPATLQPQLNSAATLELAELHLWQSHFEQGAPLLATLADAYPADTTIGDQASSIYRSLAYFEPANLVISARFAKHLSDADPTNLDRLATIGDIYANRTASSLNLDADRQLAQAGPYWRSMASVHPGVPDNYLESATVFWDYFDFDAALEQLTTARKRFNNPALYGYQAGALFEGKRDFPRAVNEYVADFIAGYEAAAGAQDSADNGSHDSHSRLLELAGRPQYASLVDDATTRAVAQHPSVEALQLRIDVLNTLHRRTDISPLVESAISHAATEDELDRLAAFSQKQHLTHAYIAALQREITLAPDAVHRIELQYQLVQAYEDQKNIPSAAAVVDSVHEENSHIVGVVRYTVDFYWRNNQPKLAVATLTQAAHESNASFAHDFTLEAIEKSNQSGDYAGARSLLKPLLTADPFNALYLNLQAQSFSLAHDEAGVRDLYTATIAALQATPAKTMDAATRRDKIALARQAMIPALTDLKDYGGAMDQHIALISAFPEDNATLDAVTAYARLHSREQQLVEFLTKTVAASPRDSRFAIDLGRVDVQFEDYGGALAAYSKAIAIRRDRPDLFIARADLEEHQQSFDAACADYDRLYLLTYKDPQWMEKAALARARQGKADLAVKALQAAWLDDRPPTAINNFRVARQLEEWGLLSQADTFAAQGVKLADNDLLATPQLQDGAVLYARLLTRERKANDVLAFFSQQLAAAATSPSSPAIIIKQVEKRGIADVTDSDWRKALVATRKKQAQATYTAALLEMASVVAEFYTPEEKSAFAALLDTHHANQPAKDVADLWIPVAKAANLPDREATWRHDILLHGGRLAAAQLEPYKTLQSARMDYAALAETLDAYALTQKSARQVNILTDAAQAWHDAGNSQREIGDLRKLVLAHQQQQMQDRLFALYLHGNVAALLQLVSGSDATSDAAGNYIFAHGDEATALKAVSTRAKSQPQVWSTSTTALLGLYFNDTSPAIDTAFSSTLGDQSIGPQLASKPDDKLQLAGEHWFYYGSRYGLFLSIAATPSHPAEDYLPAQLELAPSDAASYNTLAQTYLDVNNIDAAVAEYRHSIEIDPADPTPDIAIAAALRSAHRNAEALAAWNSALEKLRAMVDLRDVPETFWSSFASLCDDAARYRATADLKPGLETVLAAYIRKNGNYRSDELLHSAYDAYAVVNPAAAEAWILTLAGNTSAADELSILSSLTSQSSTWLPLPDLEPLFRRTIALAQQQPTSSPDDSSDDLPRSQLATIQMRYIKWLYSQHQAAEARAVLATLSPEQRRSSAMQTEAILIAAELGHLPALIITWQNDAAEQPALSIITASANTLRLTKDYANSRLLLEHSFHQQQLAQTITPTAYIALAEARIDTSDISGALDLLHRFTLQGDLYENLDSAAGLLERTGHFTEAFPLLSKLAAGTPWNASYRLRLGEAQLAIKHDADAQASLSGVAGGNQNHYATRAAAAQALHGQACNNSFGSAELTLLCAGSPSPQQADQSYFVYARVLAAEKAAPAQRSSILLAANKSAPKELKDYLRLRLFESEFSQAHYSLAKTAITPVIPIIQPSTDLYRSDTEPDNTTEDVDASSTSGDTNSTFDADDRFSVQTLIDSSAYQQQLLLSLSSMEGHLGNTSGAISYLQAAEPITSDEKDKSSLKHRLSTLRNAAEIERENQSRRPAFQSNLQQTILVRPRLTLSAAKVSR